MICPFRITLILLALGQPPPEESKAICNRFYLSMPDGQDRNEKVGKFLSGVRVNDEAGSMTWPVSPRADQFDPDLFSTNHHLARRFANSGQIVRRESLWCADMSHVKQYF